MADGMNATSTPDPDEPAPGELDGAGRRKNGRESHGYHRAERILREHKGRHNALYSMRTTIGRINAQRRDEYVQYCGGEAQLSPTLRECIHGAVKARLLLDWVDAYLMRLGESMVHRRRKTLYPVVLQRQQLADSLLRYVQQMEASLAARKNDGKNDIAAAFAAAMQEANSSAALEEEQEDIARELEIRRRRQAKLAALSQEALDSQAQALGPVEPHQLRAIQYHLDHPSTPDSQESQ
jgi:hypothetical protein